MTIEEWAKDFKSYVNELQMPRDDHKGIMEYIDDTLALLKEQEAVEHKTGHWIFESQYCEAWSHTCSECGKRMTTAVNTFANWCWNCGAKMEGQRQESR